MGKNVAVFVDVANIFYAAKAAGVDIDYVTLLRSATAGRDLVRAYAYTGLDPDNENQRNFHSFLARNGYKVVSKDIRKYGDGKVKANLDIELVVDMMKTARNLDIAIVVSGDGDFAPAIRAVQEMGVRCEVISFRGNTSSDLIEVADLFTDITQLAKVEKGSRSGRRVATDEQDLSMTEVPDKQTEGTGRGRGRGRGRDRDRDRGADREPVAASSASRTRTGGRRRVEPSENGNAGVVALPGERLSRAVIGGLTEADLARAEVFTLDDEETPEGSPVGEQEVGEQVATPDGLEGSGDDAPRRRRRRGGRGRGRGRGRAEGEEGENGELTDEEVAEDAAAATDEGLAAAAAAPLPAARPSRSRPAARIEEDELPEEPRRPRSTPFGSVWDSQLGTSTPTASALAPLPDEEFDDEPEIPEYLIAERNRGARGGARGGRGGGGGGVRGGRAAYQSAIARERFGRGGGGGINRYPDVSERTSERGGRGGAPAPRRDERPPRQDRSPAAAPAPRSGGEWSEVPPELEELLRAQLGQRPAGRPATPVGGPGDEAATTETATGDEAPAAPARRRAPARRTRAAEAVEAAEPSATDGSAAGEPDATEAGAGEPAPATRRRTTRRTATPDAAAEEVQGTVVPDAAAEVAEPAPARRATRRTTRTAADAGADEAPDGAAPKPVRRRTTRATASTGEAAATADPDGAAEEAAPKPRRRTTRRTTTADETETA